MSTLTTIAVSCPCNQTGRTAPTLQNVAAVLYATINPNVLFASGILSGMMQKVTTKEVKYGGGMLQPIGKGKLFI